MNTIEIIKEVWDWGKLFTPFISLFIYQELNYRRRINERVLSTELNILVTYLYPLVTESIRANYRQNCDPYYAYTSEDYLACFVNTNARRWEQREFNAKQYYV